MTARPTGLVALVLAAGSARRFGSDKLSALFHNEPLVHHAIRAARAAPVDRVIVICGENLALGDWPGEPRVEAVEIASTALSQSLKAGVIAAGDAAGALVFLGDMPLIPHNVAGRLATALGDAYAAVPRHAHANGHPVLLSARAFADIVHLSGDEGAGRLLRQRTDIVHVDVGEDTILLDVDRAEDLARLARHPIRSGGCATKPQPPSTR